MMPPSTNSGHLPDAFKAKITSLIKEQLKPIVTELAAQQQTIVNNLALLTHNHNVNDYQMTRLEGIRDLEQSVNFKVSGVLGFDPCQHSTMGTNLREPVPADPDMVPKYKPLGQATPAERAAQSATLIKEAGLSACQIGVPLTFQDFPDHPSMNKGKKEDPMHASVPLFGLKAPRWRAKLGLDNPKIPGTASYNGVVVPPAGKIGLKLHSKSVREMKVPMWKLLEQGADPLGRGAASSSSSPGAGTSNSPAVQGGPPGATPSNNTRTPVAGRPNAVPAPSSSTAPSARPKPLYRTYAIADMESSIAASASAYASNRVPKPSALGRTSTMASIGSTTSTTSETSTRSSLSRVSTTATAGSEPRPSPPPRTAKAPTAKTKTKAKAKQSTSKQRSKRTKTAAAAAAPTSSTSTSASISSSTITEQPKQTAVLKRGRRTAELEDTDDDVTTDSVEDREEAEPASKRRKRSLVASDTGSESTTRRSTRVTRASTAAVVTNAATPQPRPAPRGRATKGKKGNKRS
ncbi:hypothetical protein V8E52_003631 [Russula decolorans]